MFLLLSNPLDAEPLAENQARLGVITGDVGFLSQGALEWIEPHEGLPLEPGDRIRTGEDGQVELVLSENVVWILESQTELVAEDMEINSGRFNLTTGGVLGKVDSKRSAGVPQKWEFNTPASVIAIRGTEFALDYTRAEGSHLGVFEGTVELEPAETAQGRQPPVPITAGHEAVIQHGRPIQTTTKFSPRMQARLNGRSYLAGRLRHIQNTWSPFTPTVRTELRRKFVSPPPKRASRRPIHRPAAARKIRKSKTP